MKTVYHNADPVMAEFIGGMLNDAGIPAHVHQAGLYGASGEIPPNECWARIVVVHEEQATEARELVMEYLEGDPVGDATEWTCPSCGERIEPQFTQCWNCGRERG